MSSAVHAQDLRVKALRRAGLSEEDVVDRIAERAAARKVNPAFACCTCVLLVPPTRWVAQCAVAEACCAGLAGKGLRARGRSAGRACSTWSLDQRHTSGYRLATRRPRRT